MTTEILNSASARLLLGWPLIGLAVTALWGCDVLMQNQPLTRSEAVEVIERTCVQKAALQGRVESQPRQAVTAACACARASVEARFDDRELSVIASLQRTELEMTRTSSDDFQALERLRLRYNGALAQLADQNRRRPVADALRDATADCSAIQPEIDSINQ